MRKSRTGLLCAIAAFGILTAPHPAHADVKSVRMDEIVMGEKADGVCNFSSIDHVIAPTKGNDLWFIEAGARRIGKLDLASGEVSKFELPKVTPVEYNTDSIATLPGDDSGHGPCDLLFDQAGKLWFNYQAANAVGYLDPAAPQTMKLLTFPSAKSLPMAMQMGGDGNIYVQLTAVDRIARIDPKTNKIKEFPVGEKGSGVIGGTSSLKGDAHWFILMNTNKLVRYEYKTGKMESFEIPTANAAPFVVREYDDGVWFTMFRGNAIGHFDPATKAFTEIPLPTPDSAPIGIVMGLDGYLYSNLSGSDKIARIDRKAKKVVAEYPLLTPKTWPDEVKQGPDGAIWVTQYFGGKLTRLWLDTFGQDPGFPRSSQKSEE